MKIKKTREKLVAISNEHGSTELLHCKKGEVKHVKLCK